MSLNPEKIALEKRPYNEDSSTEEKQAIINRVCIYMPQIIYADEMPVASPFTINLMFDEIERLSKELKKQKKGLLIDLSKTARPNAESRRTVNDCFNKIRHIFDHVAVYTGNDILVNAAAKFTLFRINLDSYSVHKSLESALNKIKHVLHE